MERTNLWTEEEVTLLKFYYSIKDEKSWKEISNAMKEYTGIERTTTSLMSKINKLDKNEITKESIKQLYTNMVLNRKNGLYSIKFTKFITDKFSKWYGDPNDIKEDYALTKMKKDSVDEVKEVMIPFETFSEDEYSNWTIGQNITSITLWVFGLIVVIALIYVGFIYLG